MRGGGKDGRMKERKKESEKRERKKEGSGGPNNVEGRYHACVGEVVGL